MDFSSSYFLNYENNCFLKLLYKWICLYTYVFIVQLCVKHDVQGETIFACVFRWVSDDIDREFSENKFPVCHIFILTVKCVYLLFILKWQLRQRDLRRHCLYSIVLTSGAFPAFDNDHICITFAKELMWQPALIWLSVFNRVELNFQKMWIMGQVTHDYILVMLQANIKGQGALILKHPTMLCNLVFLLPISIQYRCWSHYVGEMRCLAEVCALWLLFVIR